MKGRQAAILTAAAILAGATAAPAVLTRPGAARSAAQQQRPNVVILETDDQTLAEMEVLPNVRRLIGDQGVTFDNSFVSFSLCCPSRATLLTGQYSHSNGVRSNTPPEGGFEKLDSSNTLAVWLERSGYFTVHLGKYLNGYGRRSPTEIPAGWSEWHGAVDPSTYRYDGYTLNEGGKLTTYCAQPQPACYQTDLLRDKANEIIRRRAPQGPFFLWVAFLADHAGAPRDPDDPAGLGTPSPAPRYRDRFAGAQLPTPPSFNEADVSDKPQAIRRRPLLTARQIAAVRENYQQRRETLLAVDDAVASIVDTLAQTGELDDTLILFTSDNGFFHGEHRVASGKVLLYEPSVRVPLLMRGPRIPRGVHRSQLVANVDIAPTILDATGTRPGRVEDGISLLPPARDAGREPGRDLLLDNQPGGGHFDAIRTRRWKYAEYATGERELYDLAADPNELQSRHDDPTLAGLRASLAARLHALVACGGASCHTRPPAVLATRCAGRTLRATVTGPEILAVRFSLAGRIVASDARAPFRTTIPPRRIRDRTTLRARVTLAFDRLVSLDAAVRPCR